MRRKVLVGVALLAAVAVSLGVFWFFAKDKGVLRLPGTVEIQEVRLGSKVGGRVERVVVREGQLVKPGEPLVYFDVSELRAQRYQYQARLDAALAELSKARNGPREEEKAAARAAVASAKARLDKMEAGYRPEEKEQVQAEIESLDAELVRIQKELDREARLGNLAGAESNYDAWFASQGRVVGQIHAARAKLKMMQIGSREEDKAEARADWKKAVANLDLLEAGTRVEEITAAEAKVSELQAKIKELDIQLDEAVVVAPEQAVVEVVAVRPGDLVPPNQPVVRVLRADDLWVKAYVPETELGRLRLNQEVEVSVDSYPGRRFKGRVTQIASISEFTPRNVQSADERQHQVFGFKVRVDDPQGVFKSGMAADVWVPLAD